MSRIGHNNPPADEAERIWHRFTLIMCKDEDGRPDLRWEEKPQRARPLPGRTRSGQMRPARDYALERAVARENKRVTARNKINK